MLMMTEMDGPAPPAIGTEPKYSKSSLERSYHIPTTQRRQGGILAAIRDALARQDQESAWQLQKQAAMQFAELNGWQLSPKDFGIDAIGKGGYGNVPASRSHFDHPLFFKCGRTNAAILGQLMWICATEATMPRLGNLSVLGIVSRYRFRQMRRRAFTSPGIAPLRCCINPATKSGGCRSSCELRCSHSASFAFQ
jgi:hypothetical protein